MKKTIIIFLTCTVVFTLSWSCIKSDKIREKDYEILAGTWMNEEYDSIHYKVKYEIYNDGSFIGYAKIYHIEQNVYREGVYEIVEKWKDKSGNIFLKTTSWLGVKVEGEPDFYDLNKISKDGLVWEAVYNPFEFPKEVNKDDSNYYIYFKQ